MALTTYEQIMEYIQDAKRIAIALDTKQSADTFGAVFAIQQALGSLGKHYQITVDALPKNFSFLTQSLNIQSGLKQARRLVVSLALGECGLEKFYYTTDEEKKNLEIFIVPKDGFFNPDDVRVSQGRFEYDLIITLSASDLVSLGGVYQNNTAFFHETPIINIDYKASNEKFGEINLVESTKSSVCEVVFDFIEYNFPQILDSAVSTGLLAGILEKTQSFKVPTLSPHTLEKASKLLGYKADRELVVRELFYNKSLPLVKLWGRVLARLKENKEKNLYWSLVNTDDYMRAGASLNIVDTMFEEVMSYLPKDAIIIVFSEYNGAIFVMCYSGNPRVSLKELFASYKLIETEYGVQIKLFGRELLEVEEEVIKLFES